MNVLAMQLLLCYDLPWEESPKGFGMNQGSNLSSAYDDVFRTLLNDCSKLIIPVINEVFGESYTGEETIRFAPNEHFLQQQDGGETKRITDTNFTVIGKSEKRYHLECESTVDYSILIRIFEYDAQIALDQDGMVQGNRLTVSFPHTAVIFLRSSTLTPDEMWIIIRTPGGDVEYTIPALKVRQYSIDEIFAKGLLFLIPFYLFTYEAQFDELNEDAGKLDALKAEYARIQDRLTDLAAKGVIDEFYRVTLIDMSQRVMEKLTAKHANIQKEMRSIMVGRVLDYEAKRILNQGIEQGIERGKELGRAETLVSLAKKGWVSVKNAAVEAGMSEDSFRQKMYMS